jgi:lysophospholipase L1-like esterase
VTAIPYGMRAVGWFCCRLLAISLVASCAIEQPQPDLAPAASKGPAPVTGPFAAPSSAPATAPVAAPVPEGLAPLYDGLDRLRTNPAGRDEKLRVLLLGDSHVAGGIITQRLRERFQADFGDAGRGQMVPGLPYPGRREADWKLAQTKDWTFENSLQSRAAPFGLSGFIARSRAVGASMTVAARGEGFEEVEVSFVRRPGGGAFEIRVDNRPISRIETDAPFPSADRVLLPTNANSRQLEVRTVDRRPVDLLSWGVEQKKPGVIVEGHGVSGATSWIMQKWDAALLSKDLRQRDPILILLAFGTNEGFQAKFDPQRYAADYAQVIDLMREAAPRASILLIGPPDAARDAGKPPGGDDCGWVTPANLRAARTAQQEMAARLKIAFWDWSSLMNGPCGVHDWVTRSPPLAHTDHVHLTASGYVATADALYQDVIEPYLAARGLSSRRPTR